MSKRHASSPGLYGRRSFHVHGLDPFTIKAIKYVGWAEGKTIAEVIEWLVDDDLINHYPDLARARDQKRFQREMVVERYGIRIDPIPDGDR